MRAIFRWNKTRLKDESGNVLVISALSMTALLGFMALATDVGILFCSKRNMQIAADAAAVAGSLDYLYNGSTSSAITAAKSASGANGVTDGSNGSTVTINLPPADGPNAGSSGFVEAQVSKPRTTILMGMFGFKTMTVSARAVAATPNYGQACIWLMAPTGTGLSLQGSYDIEAPGCGIYVNSPDANALSVTGGGGTVNAEFLDVVGNSTSVHATSPTTPTLDAAPRKSPWGNLEGPTESNGGCTTIDSTTTTVSGDQSGSAPGLGSAICYQKAVTLSNATLGPGVYMFEKGVTLSGTVTVNGGTIDTYGGSFNQPSNTILNITAPTSGTYDGIAVMMPASNTTGTCAHPGTSTPCLQVQFGSNNQTLDGYVYAPGAEVYLQDNGGGVTATGVVAYTMFDKASTVTITSYDKKHPKTTRNRVVALVE